VGTTKTKKPRKKYGKEKRFKDSGKMSKRKAPIIVEGVSGKGWQLLKKEKKQTEPNDGDRGNRQHVKTLHGPR